MAAASARSIFARRLKAARLARGLSQRALGIEIGLSEDVASTRINRYERGVHDCDLATAQKLAKVLNVPLPSLFADRPSIARAIERLSALSDKDVDQLLLTLRPLGS